MMLSPYVRDAIRLISVELRQIFVPLITLSVSMWGGGAAINPQFPSLNRGQEARYALRVMRLNLTFTVVVVLTLALGIGANAAVFAVLNSVLLEPLSYPQAEVSRTISRRSSPPAMFPAPGCGVRVQRE